MNESANAGKNVQAKKNTKVSGAGIFVAVAAILVVVALLVGAIGIVNDSGWLARSKTVTKTENFKVDGAMMNYFYTTQFNNYYQYYNEYVSSMFGSSSSSMDLSSYVYKFMGISDPNKSLKEQNMSSSAEGADPITVFDYYMNLTEDYVARMLTYCEFALKAGMELTEEDYADIDATLESMEKTYKTYKSLYESIGYSYPATFSAYLAQNYGTGVKEKDIRNCLELVTLAAKFEEKLTEEKKQAIIGDKSNAAVEEYVKENPSAFLMADYYSYAFTVSSKGKTDAEFEADKAEILEKAKALAACTDKEAYKAAVIDLLLEAEKESFREKNWEKYLEENENDESKANQALEEYFEKTYTEEKKNEWFDNTLKQGYKYPTTHTDLSKWIFGYEATACEEGTCSHKEGEEHDKDITAAKPGDITYFESTTTKEETVKKETTGATTEEPTTDAASAASEETTAEQTTAEETTAANTSSSTTEKVTITTYTVTVYMLEKDAYRNTEITKHFGYVMFDKKEDAEKFFEEFSKGEKNKDTLIETVEKLSSEIKPFAYNAAEDYMPGDLQDQKVDGADKWLETAKPGDCSGVTELIYTTTTTNSDSTTKETKTTYYSVLVYDQDGFEAWYCDALTGATDTAVADWYEENGLDLTFSEKAYKFIKA